MTEPETEQYEDHVYSQQRIHAKELADAGWPKPLIEATLAPGQWSIGIQAGCIIYFHAARRENPDLHGLQFVELLEAHVEHPLTDTPLAQHSLNTTVRVRDIVWINGEWDDDPNA